MVTFRNPGGSSTDPQRRGRPAHVRHCVLVAPPGVGAARQWQRREGVSDRIGAGRCAPFCVRGPALMGVISHPVARVITVFVSQASGRTCHHCRTVDSVPLFLSTYTPPS